MTMIRTPSSTTRLTKRPSRFKLEIANSGALDTLYFTDEVVGPLGEDEIEIDVKATGVNFKDIVVTMGQLAQPWVGIECSGIIKAIGKDVRHLEAGQRVMALPEVAYSTYARCRATSAGPIPEDMPFEIAATVPVVFCTARRFQPRPPGTRRADLDPRRAGGVGQAAIMLAKMIGAEIFVLLAAWRRSTSS